MHTGIACFGVENLRRIFSKGMLKQRSKICPSIRPRRSAAIGPLGQQNLIQGAAKVELIKIPALICASWSDRGPHTRGTFEVFRRIGSADKWLYTHGGKKWERICGEEGLGTRRNSSIII